MDVKTARQARRDGAGRSPDRDQPIEMACERDISSPIDQELKLKGGSRIGLSASEKRFVGSDSGGWNGTRDVIVVVPKSDLAGPSSRPENRAGPGCDCDCDCGCFGNVISGT